MALCYAVDWAESDVISLFKSAEPPVNEDFLIFNVDIKSNLQASF